MSTITGIDQVLSIRADNTKSFFTSMCCRSDGSLMVVNGGSNRIHVYNSAGKLIQSNFGYRFFSKQFTEPSLIAELPGPTIAVYDKATREIKKLSLSGDNMRTFVIGIETFSLSVSNYGHMVMSHVTDIRKRVVSIRDSQTGYVLHYFTIAPHPLTLTDAPFYAVYKLPSNIVTLDQTSCTLTSHSIDGARQHSVGKQGFFQGNLRSPSSLCTDIHGNIVVADTRNDRVVRYRGDSFQICDILLTDIERPLCVGLDKSDRLIVLTAKYCLVYDYDIRRAPLTPVPALVNGLF